MSPGSGQSETHEVDHGNQNHGFAVLRQLLVVFAQTLQYQAGSITVLHIPSMHDHREDQAQCVYDHMTLAAEDLLARIVAAKSPFSVVLTLWLSIIAALGVGFLPALRRTLTRRIS